MDVETLLIRLYWLLPEQRERMREEVKAEFIRKVRTDVLDAQTRAKMRDVQGKAREVVVLGGELGRAAIEQVMTTTENVFVQLLKTTPVLDNERRVIAALGLDYEELLRMAFREMMNGGADA